MSRPSERSSSERPTIEAPGDAPALVVAGASKRYGEVLALDDVSFTANGEIYGLLGANGAGKSTLFQAALHLVELDAGTVRVAGFDARSQALETRRRIGYLPEEPILDERLTGAELLRFVAGLKGTGDAGERRELLADFALEPQADRLIAGYSLGMRKRLALAAALLGSPPLVLLDEPLNGLDTETMRRLRRRLRALAAAGTTIVVASHVMAFVERLCARVAILRAGRLVAEGTAADLRRRTGMTDEPFEDVFLELAAG